MQPRVKIAATEVLYAAMIVTLLGCGDDAGVSDSEDPPLRALHATVLAPLQETAEQQGPASMSDQGDLLPIEFVMQLGDGCPSAPRPFSNGSTLEVAFDDYAVKTTAQDDASRASKRCTVELRVVGAENARVALTQITYVGAGLLITPGSQLALDSTVHWLGRDQTRSSFSKTWAAPLVGSWDADHVVESVQDAWSSCGAEQTSSHRLVIDTMLTLFADTSVDAMASMTAIGIEAIAKDAGIPVPTTPPRMIISFRTERCAK